MSAIASGPSETPARASFVNDPKVRGIAYQILLVVIVVAIIGGASYEVSSKLAAQNRSLSFDFLSDTTGFDVAQSLIPYSAQFSTNLDALWVGLLNTLLVAAIGVVFTTILGFAVGIARLSSNWMVARLATLYVETIRNIPLLLQLYLWYALAINLPPARQAYSVFGVAFLSQRGVFLPSPEFGPGSSLVVYAFLLGVVGAVVLGLWAVARQRRTGQPFPSVWVGLAMVIGLPLVAYYVSGRSVTFSLPEIRGFNFAGGLRVLPEFMALLVGLTVYTASFIAEIVRAGILSVARGQTEAAEALGLRSGPTLRLVTVPQAMRVILPPLTSQYLNLTKNSSLATAIGYPELVQVFGSKVREKAAAPVQTIAITMAVYLVISLITSLIMNWYNSRIALTER